MRNRFRAVKHVSTPRVLASASHLSQSRPVNCCSHSNPIPYKMALHTSTAITLRVKRLRAAAVCSQMYVSTKNNPACTSLSKCGMGNSVSLGRCRPGNSSTTKIKAGHKRAGQTERNMFWVTITTQLAYQGCVSGRIHQFFNIGRIVHFHFYHPACAIGVGIHQLGLVI